MQDPLLDVLEAATTPPSVADARRKGVYFYPNDAKPTDVVVTPDNGIVPNVSGQDWDKILDDATTPELTGRAKLKEMGRRAVTAAGEVTGDILVTLDRATAPTPDPMQTQDEGRFQSFMKAQRIKEDVSGLAEKVAPDAPGFAFKPTFAEDVAGGLGSTLPFITLGLATGGTGPAVAAVGSLGAAQGFGQSYFEALSNGASDETAIEAGLIGAAGGATESFGAEFKFLSRIFGAPGVGGLFRRFVTQAMTAAPREAVQEMGQQIISNAASKLSDEDKSYLDQVVQSGLIGGTVGALLGGVAEVAGSLGRRPVAEGQAPEAPAPQVSEQAAQAPQESQPEATTVEPPPADFPNLKPVAPVTTAQKERASFAKQRGVDVVYVEDAPFKGYYKEGKAYLNAALTDQEQAGSIVYHELAHALRDQNPKDFDRLYAAIAAVDPEGLAKAQDRYLADFGSTLAPDIAAEEGLARRIEELSGWIDLAHQNPARLRSVVARNPGLVTRLIDALKRLARMFGVEVQTSWEKQLAELGPLVQQAGTRPEIAAQIAMRIKESLDGMVGELTNPGPGRFEVAYHGSPHDFDKFTTAKMGTGEGAQAYGWGMYFAGKREIAEHYRDALRRDPWDQMKAIRNEYDAKIEQALAPSHRSLFKKMQATGQSDQFALAATPEFGDSETVRRLIAERDAAIENLPPGARLYQVDLAPAEDEYLLFDKPLDEQSPKVQAAIDSLRDKVIRIEGGRAKIGLEDLGAARRGDEKNYWEGIKTGKGGTFYNMLVRHQLDTDAADAFQDSQGRPDAQQAASKLLRSVGIRGIKFLDGTSRGKGDGTYNYVIFDDADVKITGKFAPDPVTPPTADTTQLDAVMAATNKAGDEGELTQVGSQPNPIASTSDDARTRAFQRGVREVRAPDEQVVSIAEQQRVADTLDREAVLAKAEAGEVLSAAETLALNDAQLEAVTQAMRKGSTTEQQQRAVRLNWLYQDARREVARALGVIRDALNQTGQEQLADIIAEPSVDGRRRLERIRKEMKDASPERKQALRKKRDAILKEEAAKVEKIKRDLWDAGFPPELVSRDHFTDPYLRAQIHRIISTTKSSKWDAILEYRIASMLSGPLTHARNIAGNAAYATYDQHLVRLSEAMVNTVFRDPKSAQFSELVPFYRAQLPAMAQAGRNALLAFKSERPVWEADLKQRGVSVEEGSKIDALGGQAIPGLPGRVIRVPLRALQAEDEVAKSIVGLTETVALAHRAAKAEGLTGDALVNRTHEIAADYTHPIHREAVQSAQRVTFQSESGPVTQFVMDMRTRLNSMPGGVPVGSLLLPFVKTPGAIFRIGLGLPFHPLSMMYRAATGQYQGNRTRLVRDTAQLVWALPVAAYLVYLVSLDEEEPKITGSKGIPGVAAPYSVKIGDARYSYRAIEPISTSLATVVDMATAARDSEDAGAAFGTLVKSLVDQTKDKTFLRTVGDIFEAIERPDASTLPMLVRDTLVTPFIPNIIRQPMAQADPVVHTTRIRKEGDMGVWEAGAKSIPYKLMPEYAPVIYDLWGRPVEREGSRNPTIVRLLSPVGEVTKDVHALDRLILRYNRAVLDGTTEGEPFAPRAPMTYTSVNGKTVYFTGEQYAKLTREAGQLAAAMLSKRQLNYENPTERDIETIKKAISEARKMVKNRILNTMEAKK